MRCWKIWQWFARPFAVVVGIACIVTACCEVRRTFAAEVAGCMAWSPATSTTPGRWVGFTVLDLAPMPDGSPGAWGIPANIPPATPAVQAHVAFSALSGTCTAPDTPPKGERADPRPARCNSLPGGSHRAPGEGGDAP